MAALKVLKILNVRLYHNFDEFPEGYARFPVQFPAGLGCISGTVVRLPNTQAVPQLGWNRVEAPAESRYVRSGHAYFANSYCLREAPEGWIAPTTTYGVSMIAAIERGAVLGCQFHPELSGAYGERLMSRWLSLEVTPC